MLLFAFVLRIELEVVENNGIKRSKKQKARDVGFTLHYSKGSKSALNLSIAIDIESTWLLIR